MKAEMQSVDLWEIENSLYTDEISLICGVDEAGRGPLAGPVCAAAVILPRGLVIEGLNDSKKLTDKKRRVLYELIIEQATAYHIALMDEKTIDTINILQATFRAMEQAVQGLGVRPDLVLIDGNREPNMDLPMKTIVKGDSKSANIAAASILAKVTRDRLMEELAERYPQYGFDVHKGYGTKRHYEALEEFDGCPAHRVTFLRKFYDKKS